MTWLPDQDSDSGQDYGELFDLSAGAHAGALPPREGGTRVGARQLHNLWNSPAHRGPRHDLHRRLLHEVLLTESALPRRLCHA